MGESVWEERRKKKLQSGFKINQSINNILKLTLKKKKRKKRITDVQSLNSSVLYRISSLAERSKCWIGNLSFSSTV